MINRQQWNLDFTSVDCAADCRLERRGGETAEHLASYHVAKVGSSTSAPFS